MAASVGALTAIAIIGLLIAIVGFIVGGLQPLGADVTGWYGLAIFGILLLIVPMIYIAIYAARAPTTRS